MNQRLWRHELESFTWLANLDRDAKGFKGKKKDLIICWPIQLGNFGVSLFAFPWNLPSPICIIYLDPHWHLSAGFSEQFNLNWYILTQRSCSKGHYRFPCSSAIAYAQTQLVPYHIHLWLLLHRAWFSNTDFQEAMPQLKNPDSRCNTVPHFAPFNRQHLLYA